MKIRDLSSGRTIRKPTRPDRVFAPKKLKLDIQGSSEESHISSVGSVSERSEKNDDQNRDKQESNQDVVDRENQGVVDQASMEHGGLQDFLVKVDIIKNVHTASNIAVYDNHERLTETYSLNKSTEQREEPEMCLGDSLPEGTLIKAENIKIKRTLSKTGGSVSVDFKY